MVRVGRWWFLYTAVSEAGSHWCSCLCDIKFLFSEKNIIGTCRVRYRENSGGAVCDGGGTTVTITATRLPRESRPYVKDNRFVVWQLMGNESPLDKGDNGEIKMGLIFPQA